MTFIGNLAINKFISWHRFSKTLYGNRALSFTVIQLKFDAKAKKIRFSVM